MPKNKSHVRLSEVNGARRYASIPDAAEHWAVHPATVRKWIATGLIRGYRSGPRLIRVDLNEIDAVMAGQTGDMA
jgi:excisionase family DNA binding protein